MFTKHIAVVFCFSFTTALSQTILVVDNATGKPIPQVAIVSTDPPAAVTTNNEGFADIGAFRGSDSVSFSHISYTTRVLRFSDLENLQRVGLVQAVLPFKEVVVSAHRFEEGRREIPHRVEIIRPEQISMDNPQTAADLLASSGYVYVQKSQLAGGSPMLRGFATNRVLLVVDGVRLNNAIFRLGNLQNVISLDGGSIQSTEILFGPGAVLYGSDAIGGVMDFTTLGPRFSERDPLFAGTAFTRFSSANSERTGHVDLSLGLSSLALLTSFTYSDFGDLRTGSNGNAYFLRPIYQERINGIDSQVANPDHRLQVHSGYQQTNFMLKLGAKPSPSWALEFAFHSSASSNAPRYDRLSLDADSDGVLDFAQWYYGPQKWMMSRIGITHTNVNPLYDHFLLTSAVQNYEESRHDRRTGNVRLRNQIETVEALSVNADVKKQMDEHIVVFYGAEVVFNTIGSRAYRTRIDNGTIEPTNTRYPDGAKWLGYGGYAKVRFAVSPEVSLNAGLRYTLHRMEAVFDTSSFPFPFTRAENTNGAFNGSLGFVYNPGPSWHFYGNASTGFRAPNIDDIGKVFESEPGSVVVPNPNLNPEYAYNVELGLSGSPHTRLDLDFSVYYTFLDKALARRSFSYNGQDSILYDGQWSAVQAIQNIVNAYVLGFQAGVHARIGAGFELRSTFSLQSGREQDEGSLKYFPLRHAAPAFGSTHLTYEQERLKFDLSVVYNAGMEFEDLALSERGDPAPYAKNRDGNPFVPAWYTLNLRTAVTMSRFLSVHIGIENITDQLYRPYASGISAPGRNFVVSLRGQLNDR